MRDDVIQRLRRNESGLTIQFEDANYIGMAINSDVLAERAGAKRSVTFLIMKALNNACVVLNMKKAKPSRNYIIGFQSKHTPPFIPLDFAYEDILNRLTPHDPLTAVGWFTKHLNELVLVCRIFTDTTKQDRTLRSAMTFYQQPLAVRIKDLCKALVKLPCSTQIGDELRGLEKVQSYISLQMKEAKSVAGIGNTGLFSITYHHIHILLKKLNSEIDDSDISKKSSVTLPHKVSHRQPLELTAAKESGIVRVKHRPHTVAGVPYWKDRQKMLNFYVDARRHVFPYGTSVKSTVNDYYIADVTPRFIVNAVETICHQCHEFEEDRKFPHPPLKVFEAILARYRLLRRGRTPSVKWLGTTEFSEYAHKIIHSYEFVRWEDWAKYFGTWDDEKEYYDRWVEQVRSLCEKLAMPDPIKVGGVHLEQYNHYVLWRAMNSFMKIEERYQQETRLLMMSYDYLSANLLYLKNRGYLGYDFLYGEDARRRAWKYAMQHEPYQYADPENKPQAHATVH